MWKFHYIGCAAAVCAQWSGADILLIVFADGEWETANP